MGRVQDKVALITGGASGIGRATAMAMAREGASVAVSDLQEDAGAETVKALEAAGAQAVFLRHDVTEEDDWERIIAAVVDRFGRLDILFNNAGVGGNGLTLEEMTLEAWRQTIAVNLDGVFLGIKHGIRAMKANGGSIINTSSVLGFVGIPLSGAYTASKGGVRLLTKAAAMECASLGYNIRVNSVHPGFIDTPMVQGAVQRRGPQMTQFIETYQPGGAMGRPEDIAAGVLYLASDESRFNNGSELVIDGGLLAR